RAAGPGGLQTVGTFAVRNADLPPAMTSFAEATSLILERRLFGSRGVAVLERKRLARVNREAALPTDRAEAALRASLALLELEVGRSPGGDGLRLTAVLTDAGGRAVGKATAEVPRPDAAAAAEALLPGVPKALKAAPP